MSDPNHAALQLLRLIEGLTQRGITVTITAGTPIAESAVDAALAALDRTTRAHAHLCGDCRANVRGALAEPDRG